MKLFLDTNTWLSAKVFGGLCEAILTETAQRNWLLTTRLVQAEGHEVLGRKFPHLPQALALFDGVCSAADCVPEVAEPADDNDEPWCERHGRRQCRVYDRGPNRAGRGCAG